MTRKEFIGLIGSSAIIGCLGCSKKDEFVLSAHQQDLTQGQNTGHIDTINPRTNNPYPNDAKIPAPPQKIDFSIDLNQSQFSPLLNNGGVVRYQKLIIAKTLQGQYIAASEFCTHNGVLLEFSGVDNKYWCPAHGSQFSTDGSLLNGPAQLPLKTYKTQLTGLQLRIYED